MLQLQKQHGDLLGPFYPGHGVGTSAKDSPECAGIRKRVCALYGVKSAADRRKEISAKLRGLSQAQRRMEELDRPFQRLYEDNVSGKISDERFTKLSGGYEAEQKELQEKVAILQAELTGQEEQAMNLDRFLAIVKKYTEIEKLTPTILTSLWKKSSFTPRTRVPGNGCSRWKSAITVSVLLTYPTPTKRTAKRHSQN